MYDKLISALTNTMIDARLSLRPVLIEADDSMVDDQILMLDPSSLEEKGRFGVQCTESGRFVIIEYGYDDEGAVEWSMDHSDEMTNVRAIAERMLQVIRGVPA